MALNPLERARKQRAQKLLGALQDDLYAQMNLEKDESRHKGANVEDSERKAQTARLLDSHERERIWTHELAPLYKVRCIILLLEQAHHCFHAGYGGLRLAEDARILA